MNPVETRGLRALRFYKSRQKMNFGSTAAHDVRIRTIEYNKDVLEEQDAFTLDDAVKVAHSEHRLAWIQIEGIFDSSILEQMSRRFGFESVWLNDLLRTDHRPKVEQLNELLFLSVKTVCDRQNRNAPMEFEQVSLFLGKDFVISFQETKSDILEPVKERLRQSKGMVRESGADFLFYALTDTLIDRYFASLESLGQDIETLEEFMVHGQESNAPQKILKLRSDILYISRAVYPVRETLSHIVKTDRADMSPTTLHFLKDVYEHSIYLVDVIDNYRQLLDSMMETYMSHLNQRTNEAIKFLTTFSIFFFALSFIVALFQMGFMVYPEFLGVRPLLLACTTMVLTSGLMFYYFHKKKWL